jgi:hypothetical protein
MHKATLKGGGGFQMEIIKGIWLGKVFGENDSQPMVSFQ